MFTISWGGGGFISLTEWRGFNFAGPPFFLTRGASFSLFHTAQEIKKVSCKCLLFKSEHRIPDDTKYEVNFSLCIMPY